ncbi:MAG TPA: efflux RND transporter periplasmic adaptor subunit [Gemmataceae bacterium]|nr:efflux RND transporter periplasmic adaptor subunit [Gemmataceae bacterium]
MKKLLFILVLIGLGLVGAAYWITFNSRTPGEGQFTTISVERGMIMESVSATGILQPREGIAVGSVVSGEVVKIYAGADFNRQVNKGQPLLELDSRMARLNLDKSKSTVELAKADVARVESAQKVAEAAYDRAREALDKGVLKKTDLDIANLKMQEANAAVRTAKIKVEEAQEGLKAAQLGLELTIIKSPADGVILDRNVVLGQMASPQLTTPLFTIASDLGQMRLHAQVAEGDIGRVDRGQKAIFTVYAYSDGNETFEGVVREKRLKPNNVQGAVFFPTIIEVKNKETSYSSEGVKEWMLRPGMTATVDIQRRKHDKAWKMPNAALNFQLDDGYQSLEARRKIKEWETKGDAWKYVWILKDKKPWPIFVRIGPNQQGEEVGIKDGQFTEVLEWDPELGERYDPPAPAEYPQVIIAAPPVTKSGLFDKPTGLKFS